MSSFSKLVKGTVIDESGDGRDFFTKTLARLETIQSHLSDAPRTTRLKNKVCIITGAGSLKGIGRATALTFAHHGAHCLYLLDFDATNLPELKTSIETRYPDVKVTTLQADAADEAAISGVCSKALEDEGRLDIFFANAGIVSQAHLYDITSEQFMNVLRVNTLSCFLAIKYASKAMMKADPSRGKESEGGSIILTASVAGLRSGGGPVDYSASKAAVNNLAQTAPWQLQKSNVRVNSICPGLIETAMTKGAFDHARNRGSEHRVGQLNPSGRYGVAQEIANAALFLASDEASYVTGQNWAVDGGLSSSNPVLPGRWF